MLHARKWNHLVRILPGAYSPKGRRDAELICGLELLCQEAREVLETRVNVTLVFHSCTLAENSALPLNLFTFVHSYNNENKGILSKCIERIVVCASKVHKQCAGCNDKISCIQDASVDLADFIMVELGLHDSKNVQVPPFQIGQDISIFGCTYQLTACVLTQPGHFLNIIHHASQ